MFCSRLLPGCCGRGGSGRRLLAAAAAAGRTGPLSGRGACCAAHGPGQRRLRLLGAAAAAPQRPRGLPWRWANELGRHSATEASQATLASVAPVFAVMKFDKKGNITSFERKKTELYQELGLQARDLRFQHLMSIATRNNRIIIRMEISNLQGRLNILQPLIIETLEALVDPKLFSVDRSKLHILLQNGKSLSELETDLKVFKETILEILDEEELIEELCLTKWTDPQVFEESMSGIDHAEEMELLLENYYRQGEDLANEAREIRTLIDDSESVIFINLDSHRNVMMRLNLQLTMGTFSLSLFGLIGVAFGMNLESSFEEDHRAFWLVTGIMFLGSGLIWRRLLSFLGRHLEPSLPPHVPTLLKKTHPTAGRVEMKSDHKTEAFGSSRSTLTNR
ncbi:magnesium transporter MRS2 homolog, mitochondrial isoform X2 [Emydura macquarii macquarii]|uniref:magnesium transporter MRS2 homolog, mitochondrial isoform X2 n=1 Tax=Emydura macquarii macquarii TaxID=1129001 RepID=UPI00352BBABC